MKQCGGKSNREKASSVLLIDAICCEKYRRMSALATDPLTVELHGAKMKSKP